METVENQYLEISVDALLDSPTRQTVQEVLRCASTGSATQNLEYMKKYSAGPRHQTRSPYLDLEEIRQRMDSLSKPRKKV